MNFFVAYAPFADELKADLKAMIKDTAFGGSSALVRHRVALSDTAPNPDHLIGAVINDGQLIGWISVGANIDTSSTEAVIRCYLDCIYISPRYREVGHASSTVSDAAQTLSTIVFRDLLPHNNNEIIPLDVELSAIHVSDEGEFCVEVFERSMKHSVLILSEHTSYVFREFINEARRGI